MELFASEWNVVWFKVLPCDSRMICSFHSSRICRISDQASFPSGIASKFETLFRGFFTNHRDSLLFVDAVSRGFWSGSHTPQSSLALRGLCLFLFVCFEERNSKQIGVMMTCFDSSFDCVPDRC